MVSYNKLQEIKTSSWFQTPINIAFWGSAIYCVYQLFHNYKISAMILLFWLLVIIPYWIIFREKNYFSAIRDFTNILDTPIDYVKELFHCSKLPFGYQLNISFIMKNRRTTWDIIRKQGYYDNCDPQDYKRGK